MVYIRSLLKISEVLTVYQVSRLQRELLLHPRSRKTGYESIDKNIIIVKMADSRAKKRKVDDVDGLKDKGPFSSVFVYIVPKKLSKARLEFLKSRSRDKGFTVAEGFR